MTRWLLGLIVATGLIHLATLSVDSAPLHWIFKLLPMTLIITLAVTSHPGRTSGIYKGLIVTGLIFSIGGDAFLLIPGDSWFTMGLASFLIGHLFYTAAMLTRLSGPLLGWLSGIPIVLYCIWMANRFYEVLTVDDSASGLWIPDLCYIIVIGLMFWSALLTGNRFAALGALLFVISDSVLAWNKFVEPVPSAGLLIMLTYFSAQLFLAGSISGSLLRRGNTSAPG
ncbi:lysoplasmalogenase [Paenibacillus paeoniae]|uniref:Lysoplasmalogenase n=1 Tax=Paenibacillus paeoniae TaxID=2292705 RepID=A0A371P8M4_9BACL|nr:lysoplasmalogenase [Paenibacillus paeoniae]REK71846.1 lysoplasmalogenase [Paenibacillus paeoniae]